MADTRDNFEKLFLFEFLVDQVMVRNSKLNMDPSMLKLLGPTGVRFQFLNYPPIEVCEDSFSKSTKPLDDAKKTLMDDKVTLMKTGKSCMFSLSSVNSKNVMIESTFDVHITVVKYKLQRYFPGRDPGPPEEVYIGKTKINLSDLFQDIIRTLNEGSSGDKTDQKTHTKKGCKALVDNSGNDVGKIVFLIRVSCFGFMIVTGFKLPQEEEGLDFKYKRFTDSKDDITVPPERPPEVSGGPCETSESPREVATVCRALCDDVKKEPKSKKRGSRKKKKEDEEESGTLLTSKQPVCPFGFPATPCRCCCRSQSQPEGLRSLHMRSQGDAQSLAARQEEYPPTEAGQSSVGNGTTGGGHNRARDVDIEPGAVGIRGNQLVLKMPQKKTQQTVPVEGKFASTVYYKVNDDDPQNGARNVVQILPQSPVAQVDKSKVNEKLDVLVLKLGKKRLAAGKKPKLQLELRTPKMKEEKPMSEAKETQYLESDIPKPAKSEKGSKKSAKSNKGSKKGGKKKK